MCGKRTGSSHDRLWLSSVRFKSSVGPIFYNERVFRWVRVNTAGEVLLTAFSGGSSPRDALAGAAEYAQRCVSDIEKPGLDFIRLMVSRGVLSVDEPDKQAALTIPDRLQPSLRDVYLNLTDRCNMHCSYCYDRYDRQLRRSVGKRRLSVAQWKDALAETKELGATRAIFTGGEPLLFGNLKEVATCAKQLGFKTHLLTNGTFLAASWFQELYELFDRVQIGLDPGPNGASEPAAQAAIALFEAGKRGLSLDPVLTRQTIDYYPRYRAWANERLPGVPIHPTVYVPNSSSPADLELLPSRTQLRKHLLKASSDIHAHPTALSEHTVPKPRLHCGAGVSTVCIAFDGSVYPCQSLQRDDYLAGNILVHPISEIWEKGEVFSMLRGLTVAGIKGCSSCPLRLVCGGGCRASALNTQGDIRALNTTLCDLLLKDLAIEQLAASATELVR